MPVNIRPYREKDWELVKEITEKSFKNTHDEKYLKQIIADPQRIVTVATKRQRVVGFLALHVNPKTFIAYVDTLAVTRQWRRYGIGGGLMSTAETQAKKHGCTTLILDVHVKGPITWYQKRGFTVARQRGFVKFKDGTQSKLLAKGLYWGEVFTPKKRKKTASAGR